MKRAIATCLHAVFGIFLVCFVTGEVNAYPITVEIQARITSIYDTNGYLSGAIGLGDIIRGTYNYETDLPDSNILPDVGDYWHTTSPYGFQLSSNGYSFRTDPDNVEMIMEMCNDRRISGWDAYNLISYNNLFDIDVPADPVFPDVLSRNFIAFYLRDNTGTALSSTDLPLADPVLSDWTTHAYLNLSTTSAISPELFYDIRADVFSIAPYSSPVPEPATILLLGSGIAGLLGYSGARRRK